MSKKMIPVTLPEEVLFSELASVVSQRTTTDPQNLEALSEDYWIRWIEGVLSGEPVSPTLNVSRTEPHHAILALWEKLGPVARIRLSRSVGRVFEATPLIHENHTELFYLIQMLSRMKPSNARRYSRRVLAAGRLKGMRFGERDLHLMLAATVCEYDVDEDLAYILLRHATSDDIHQHGLVYFRLLAKGDGALAWDFFERQLLPRVASLNLLQIARVLKDVFRMIGYKSFAEWYVDRLATLVTAKRNEFIVMSELLQNQSTQPSGAKADPYCALVTLISQTLQRREPRSLVAIARLKDELPDMTDRALASLLLACESQGIVPWDLTDPEEAIVRSQTITGRVAVVWEEGDNEYLDPINDAKFIRSIQKPLSDALERSFARLGQADLM